MNIVLGIGNIQRGDDGAGPYLARSFQKNGWLSIDGGMTPENYTSILRKEEPDVVVLIDAADMKLPPGEFRKIPLDRIADVSLGTHGSSLTAFFNYLSSFVTHVIFIGIQPEEIHDSPILSLRVKAGLEILKKFLIENNISDIPYLHIRNL